MKTKSYLYCYKIIYLTFIILLPTVSIESLSTEKFSDYKKYEMIKTKFSLSEVTKGINFGWGMTFIDEQSWLNPQGTLMAGRPARFTGIVSRSARYIASGSSACAPLRKAVVGAVGVSSTSTDWKAASKSRRIKVRTCCAFR